MANILTYMFFIYLFILIIFIVIDNFINLESIDNFMNNGKNIPVLIYDDPKKKFVHDNLKNFLNHILETKDKDLLFNSKVLYFDDSNIIKTLNILYNNGHRQIVGMGGTSQLSRTDVLDFLHKHQDVEVYNMSSTGLINKRPKNLYRFVCNDTMMIAYVYPEINKDNPILIFDQNDNWAINLSKLFKNFGNKIVGYNNGKFDKELPENNIFIIVASDETEKIISLIPETCPKLYGFDGSIFYKFNDKNNLNKAYKMKFECSQYEPIIITKVVEKNEIKSKIYTGYEFPVLIDCIIYAKLRKKKYSHEDIQSKYLGFTGSLELTDNDRKYGNFSFYRIDKLGEWLKTKKILIDELNNKCIVHYNNNF